MEHGQVAQELPQLFDSLVGTLQQTLDSSPTTAPSMDVEMDASSSSDTAATAAAAAVSSSEGTANESAGTGAATAASVVQGDTFFGGGAMTTYRALRAGLETARVWNQLCRHQPLFPGQFLNYSQQIYFIQSICLSSTNCSCRYVSIVLCFALIYLRRCDTKNGSF